MPENKMQIKLHSQKYNYAYKTGIQFPDTCLSLHCTENIKFDNWFPKLNFHSNMTVFLVGYFIFDCYIIIIVIFLIIIVTNSNTACAQMLKRVSSKRAHLPTHANI